ncbi:hypothetical protein Bhyg_13500, partial [Pseudolycoriella hygida]
TVRDSEFLKVHKKLSSSKAFSVPARLNKDTKRKRLLHGDASDGLIRFSFRFLHGIRFRIFLDTEKEKRNCSSERGTIKGMEERISSTSGLNIYHSLLGF